MSKSTNELVNEALKRWVEVTKTDPERKVFSFGGSGFSQYDLGRHLETLNESRSLDSSGLTTFMLLRGLTDVYLDSVSFTAKSVILDFGSVESATRPLRELRAVLEMPEVLELVSDFRSSVEEAAKVYGVSGELKNELKVLLDDKWRLAFVRRDALRSMETLGAHQFCQGEPSKSPLKLNRKVPEFWDVGSLVRATMSQKIDGVTLAVIRDEEAVLSSFFVFCIRNGETVTVLTDRDEGPHPDFKRMTRNPGRSLEARAERHWFPYWLLDVEGEGKNMYAKTRKQLALHGSEAVPLCEVNDLKAEEFVWLILVSGLILDVYWKQDTKLQDLSYTAEMVRDPYALVASDSALAASGRYRPLDVPRLTLAEVAEAGDDPQWQGSSRRWNSWATERYGKEVPESFYNAVGVSEVKALLSERLGDCRLSLKPKRGVFGEEESVISLRGLDKLTFGPKQKIDRDRLWAARLNQARAVDLLVQDEFDKESKKAVVWARKAVLANRRFILEGAARLELFLPYVTWKSREGGNPFPREDRLIRKNKNSIEVRSGSSMEKVFRGLYWSTLSQDAGSLGVGFPDWNARPQVVRCGKCEETVATIWGVVRPNCPEALALLFSVKVEDMPFGLQHFWGGLEPYEGNPILDRLDPEDWAIENPWNKLDLQVRIALCRRCFHGIRKELGLPRLDPVTLVDKKRG